MAKYGGHLADFVTTTGVKTALMLWPLSNKQNETVELIMTGSGTVTPADTGHQASAAYCTSAVVGVGTTVTAEKFDQGAAAAISCLTSSFTQEPTTYGSVFPVFFGFNQRGGQRWAVPQGEGLKGISNVSQKNLGWRVKSSAAGQVDSNMQWWE